VSRSNRATVFLDTLESHAASAPDRPAVIDGEQLLTYPDLLARVRDRADSLVAAGVQPGARVAIVAENSADFLVAAFAVWRAGAVLVTVYPSSGVPDIAYCLDRSDPGLVLVDGATEAPVRQAAAEQFPLVRVDKPPGAFAALTGRMPNPAAVQDRLGTIFFTSGTTSRPKAIMESEEGILAGAREYAAVWHLGPDDRTVVALPLAWAYGLNTSAMSTLYAGGTVITLRRAHPDRMIDAVIRLRATFVPGVTTMFVKMVGWLESSAAEHDFSSLRLCVSAGEPRNEPVFDRWTELTGRPVHDSFCATECYPVITYDPTLDPAPRRGSAGKVLDCAGMRVVDADGRPVPRGEVGEAHWQGPNTMLGYWRDDEQTAKAFTADRWYRSNDLVRVDEDGYVFVMGRLSDMVIRGGSNVSPAEVERVLRDHPAVTEAAVVGLPDPIYGQQVAAAVVLAAGTALDRDDLTGFVSARLAAYKVPTRVRAVGRLPLNGTTGKVDRRAVAAALATDAEPEEQT
jgi:long-chain acyl-CoA synthetase